MNVRTHTGQISVRLTRLSLVLCLLQACSGDGPSAPRNATIPAQNRNFATNLHPYIVAFKPGVNDRVLRANEIVSLLGGKVRFVFSKALNGFASDLPEAAITTLLARPDVAYINDDRPQAVLTATQSSPPNWGLDRIDQRGLPLNFSYYYERTGAGVHVYIFDTGVSNHADLSGRLGNGYNAVPDGGDEGDVHGHGTHTATIAAGTLYGVAKGATVHSVRVSTVSESQPSWLIAGIDWVMTNRSLPAVANMSLKYDTETNSVDSAVRALIMSGVAVVAAAGQDGADACSISPARLPEAITVSATDSTDSRALISPGHMANYGSCVDLFAPGNNITAGWIGGSTATLATNGTSNSAPLVTGTIAQYLQEFPTATPADVTTKLLDAATSHGAVFNLGTGSPDKLLFSWYANDKPYAEFWADNCGWHYCNYNADYGKLSSYDDEGISSYYWFTPYVANPGSTQYGGHVQFFFNSNCGGLKVQLTVTDAQGRTDIIEKYYYVPC